MRFKKRQMNFTEFLNAMGESALINLLKNKDWQEVREIQKEILKSYDKDFSKHAPGEIVPRIRQIWNSVPAQLSKENRKFLYGVIKEGARAREYEIARFTRSTLDCWGQWPIWMLQPLSKVMRFLPNSKVL